MYFNNISLNIILILPGRRTAGFFSANFVASVYDNNNSNSRKIKKKNHLLRSGKFPKRIVKKLANTRGENEPENFAEVGQTISEDEIEPKTGTPYGNTTCAI